MNREEFPLPGRERVGVRVIIKRPPSLLSPPAKGGDYFFAFFAKIRLARRLAVR
jgi:hypothetical protein